MAVAELAVVHVLGTRIPGIRRRIFRQVLANGGIESGDVFLEEGSYVLPDEVASHLVETGGVLVLFGPPPVAVVHRGLLLLLVLLLG